MNDKNCCDCSAESKRTCNCCKCEENPAYFKQFHRFSMIMASAGTGKTYNLALRYLQLLAFGVAPSEILAVTFTRKAAGEIFNKIISILLKIIQDTPKCPLAGKTKLLQILRKLLCSENELHISTIDSFFSTLLTAYAPELGIRNSIVMIDENDTRPKDRVLRQWLRYSNKTEREELRELIKKANNDEQSGFASAMEVLLRYVYSVFLQNKNPADGTLAVWGAATENFNLEDVPNAEELLRISDYLDIYAETISNKTLNERLTALSKYISNHAKASLPDPVGKLIENFTKNNAENWAFELESNQLFYNKIPIPAEPAGYIRRAIRFIVRRHIDFAKQKTLAIFSLMQKFDRIYSGEARSNGFLTFSDLPYLLKGEENNNIFHMASGENINLEERLDATLNHYLFDEFQDTSDIQWYIFENLVDELLSAEDDRFRSLFCVGDIKQSIYSWRGGNPELFGKVTEKMLPAAEYKGYDPRRNLFESYRSSGDVLDTVNRIFSGSGTGTLFDRCIEKMQFTSHESKKDNYPGFSTLLKLNYNSKQQVQELNTKARLIFETVKRHNPFAPGKKLTVGVLQHKNDDIRKLADELKTISMQENFDIPISIDGWIEPQNSMAFTVLRELLTIAEHPADKYAAGFLKMLRFDNENNTCREEAGVKNIVEKLGYQLDIPSLENLSSAIRDDIFKSGISGFIQRFLSTFGREFSNYDYSRIEAVRGVADKFDGSPDEFLNAIDKWLKSSDQSVDKTIQFMTVHKAKGLEFDIVFLPDTSTIRSGVQKTPDVAYDMELSGNIRWVDYLPPQAICRLIPNLKYHLELKEHREFFDICCKYYVALTRAKRAMYIFTRLPVSKSDSVKFEVEMCSKLSKCGIKNAVPELQKLISKAGLEEDCEIIYASGDENWFIHSVEEKEAASPAENLCRRAPLFKYPEKHKSLASRQENNSFTPAPEQRFDGGGAAQKGTVLHELFEKIGYTDDVFDAGSFFDRMISSSVNTPELREIFTTSLAPGSEIREALKRPETPHKLWIEKHFLQKEGNTLIAGAFDRVIIYTDAEGSFESAEILDYKSDNTLITSELIERHRAQLELYRKSLHRMTGIKISDIKLKIAALRSGKIVEIE